MDMLTKNLDIALQVLDDVIMTRWKVLPRDQCQGNDGAALANFSFPFLNSPSIEPHCSCRQYQGEKEYALTHILSL